MDGQFKIKSYGYGELAMLYFPNSNKRSASTQLGRWVSHNKSLKNQLRLAGFTRGQKILTPIQVGIIIQKLGEP